MPELPEVETIRSDLAPILRGRTIKSVSEGASRYPGIGRVANKTILRLRRRGKYLIADLGSTELIIHLGMSGRLLAANRIPKTPHIRAVLSLDNGASLIFVDRRRFGTVEVVSRGDYRSLPTLLAMGPEPLSRSFRLDQFTAHTASSKAVIKALLLNQRLVAGLGNIYADEVLHRARIHPGARGLLSQQARRLHATIRRVIQQAIAHRGTTFSLYRDGLLKEGDFGSFLRVFGREGQACKYCGTVIVKLRVAGRGTHICPRCQPEPLDRRTDISTPFPSQPC